MRILLTCLAAIGILSGCAIGPRPLVDPGAEPILEYMQTKGLERHKRSALSVASLGDLIGAGACKLASEANSPDVHICLARALQAANSTDMQTPLNRNRIQDYLIAVSNEQCRLFKGQLRTASAEPNFWLGTFTTLFGAAGSITNSIEGARTLAGLAATAAGIRAEYNQDYFASLTADVIIGAIDSARRDSLSATTGKRGTDGKKAIESYTIEGAVADVVEYHSLCSIASGLVHANKALVQYDDIGIKKFDETMTRLALAPNARNRLVREAVTPAAASDLVLRVREKLASLSTSMDTEIKAADSRWLAKKPAAVDCKTANKDEVGCKARAAFELGLTEVKKLAFASDGGDDTKPAADITTAQTELATAETEFDLANTDDQKRVRAAKLNAAKAKLASLIANLESKLAALEVDTAAQIAKLKDWPK